ncbi:MAG: FecR domain-containing protein [Prevotella sp.]|nr:FecR domain-containing protein [Prevotella sp.]
MNNPIDFSRKLLLYLKDELSEQEAIEIQQLLEENEEFRRLEQELRDKKLISQQVAHMQSFDVEGALEKVLSKQKKQTKKARTFSLKPLRYAAAILLLVVAGGVWWYKQYTKVTPPEISDAVQLAMQQSRESGTQEADLELISENLNEKAGDVTEAESQMKDDNSSLLSLQSSLTKEQLLKARRITTKHDKEFWVTLDDGTLVHLNYNTRLIYPEKFGRGDRNVILDGEAYFMVAKDKSRPFVVHTPQGEVKVYGTEFMVNTRSKASNSDRDATEETSEGDYLTTVVLVSGSVSFTPNSGNEIMMTPGQQISIGFQQTSITLREVDTAPYVAWNEGKFFFEEWTLERIMQVMARWYDREVEFTSEDIKQQKYSGNFDRYEDIHPTMEAIESITGLKITFAPGKLIIEP